jgi:pyruvate/2-oxoglutarate dehydrogenase complex dihydrolipoamide dehydrogenase (E3) component
MHPDIIIVGSGQAGVPLATRLVAAGKRVLIAERAEFGGTCVNVGCTPTKTMIASARAAHVARTAARLGVRVQEVTVDLSAIVERKDSIVRRWRQGIERSLRDAGDRLRIVKGHARFVGEREIEANGERHRAETIILNVGARPSVPEIQGLDSVPFLDNRRLMELRQLPAHLIILGGGYIGCELGQMFRRFGAEVTILDHNEHLLSREDPDISTALEEVFRAEGIRLALSSKVEGVDPEETRIVVRMSDGKELRGSHLLVAAGRRPNTDDLGCDAAGVKLDRRGFIIVDDGYATSARDVFAVGDATFGPQFTHSSWDDHRLLFERLMGRNARPRSSRVVPYSVFTDPQVAGVGLTEREAREKGIAYEAATMPFGEIARAAEVDETAGTMKLLVDPKIEKILGCRIVGAQAGELIHIFVSLMQANASARAIVDAEFIHPTFAEGVQSLVMRLKRYALA